MACKGLHQGITVTVIVSLTGFGQPLSSVTVSMYEVVLCGPATGLSVVAFIRELRGDHAKFVATILACSSVVLPKHILTSGPAFACGYGTAVIFMASVAEQPPIKAWSLYWEFDSGVIMGFSAVTSLTPCDGDHKNFNPFVLGFNRIPSVRQMVVSAPIFKDTADTTFTVTVSELIQPFHSPLRYNWLLTPGKQMDLVYWDCRLKTMATTKMYLYL